MKGLKNILFFILLTVYLVAISGFISDREQLEHVTDVRICIQDSLHNRFLHAADVRNLLDQKHFNLSGIPAGSVDLRGIEKSLVNRQLIRRADAYITEPGILHIDIWQKSPFVRIDDRSGQDFYLDRQGNIIPEVDGFSPYVLVINGNISEPFRVGQTLNIFQVKHDTLPAYQKTLYDAYRLARFISSDKFWNAQIEQVYVNKRYEFELIPRVGAHVIELGGVDNMEEKFDNLKLLYLEGFNNIGWNQYEKISLKYKNQVVCTKIQ